MRKSADKVFVHLSSVRPPQPRSPIRVAAGVVVLAVAVRDLFPILIKPHEIGGLVDRAEVRPLVGLPRRLHLHSYVPTQVGKTQLIAQP